MIRGWIGQHISLRAGLARRCWTLEGLHRSVIGAGASYGVWLGFIRLVFCGLKGGLVEADGALEVEESLGSILLVCT